MAMTYDQARAEFAKQNPQRPDLVPQKPQPQVAQVPQPMPKSQLAPAPTLAEKPLTPDERARVDNIVSGFQKPPSGDTPEARGLNVMAQQQQPQTIPPASIALTGAGVGGALASGITAGKMAAEAKPVQPSWLVNKLAGAAKWGADLVAKHPVAAGVVGALTPTDTVSQESEDAELAKFAGQGKTPEVTNKPVPTAQGKEGIWAEGLGAEGTRTYNWTGGEGKGSIEFKPTPGSQLAKQGMPGGTVNVVSGPGRPAEMSDAEWAAVPAAQKSQMNIAAYNQAADAEKQRRLQRTAAADGRQVDEATGTIKGTVGYDRAHGDVGSVGDTGGYGILDKGYEAARAADMNRRGAADDMVHWANNHLGPKGRAAVAAQVYDNLSKPVSTGADIGDQIQLARLAQDQNQETNRSQLERQKMGLDLAKWDREQAGAAEGRASEAAYKKAQISNMERTQQDKRAEDLDKVIGTSAGISAAPAELQGPLKQWAGGLIGNMPASQATTTVESALASALAEDQLTLKDLPNIKGDQLQKLYVRLQARLGKLQ